MSVMELSQDVDEKGPADATKMEDCGDETSTNSTDAEDITCPLFMDGLPRNFATNPALAAIASLVDGDDDDADGGGNRTANKETHVPWNSEEREKERSKSSRRATTELESGRRRHRAGGGKIGSEKSRLHRKSKPYSADSASRTRRTEEQKQAAPQQQRAPVGEAQLFMKMWKL